MQKEAVNLDTDLNRHVMTHKVATMTLNALNALNAQQQQQQQSTRHKLTLLV